MIWVVVFVAIGMAEELIGAMLHSHVTLGQWAFRTRPDGTFSRWQIAGQILLLGPLAAGCLWAMAVCILDIIHKLSR